MCERLVVLACGGQRGHAELRALGGSPFWCHDDSDGLSTSPRDQGARLGLRDLNDETGPHIHVHVLLLIRVGGAAKRHVTTPIVADLVGRNFIASEPEHLWVRPTHINAHASACSSQYVMPMSRYIVVAVATCFCACPRLPVRR